MVSMTVQNVQLQTYGTVYKLLTRVYALLYHVFDWLNAMVHLHSQNVTMCVTFKRHF